MTLTLPISVWNFKVLPQKTDHCINILFCCHLVFDPRLKCLAPKFGECSPPHNQKDLCATLWPLGGAVSLNGQISSQNWQVKVTYLKPKIGLFYTLDASRETQTTWHQNLGNFSLYTSKTKNMPLKIFLPHTFHDIWQNFMEWSQLYVSKNDCYLWMFWFKQKPFWLYKYIVHKTQSEFALFAKKLLCKLFHIHRICNGENA